MIILMSTSLTLNLLNNNKQQLLTKTLQQLGFRIERHYNQFKKML